MKAHNFTVLFHYLELWGFIWMPDLWYFRCFVEIAAASEKRSATIRVVCALFPNTRMIGHCLVAFVHSMRRPVRMLKGRLGYPMGAMCWLSVRFSAWA